MKKTDFAIELLSEGRKVNILGRGNSMRPYLVHERDKIVLEPSTSIKVGDVVFASLPNGKQVVHRVVNIALDNVTLMGDSNMSTEACKLSDIHGRAIGFIRKGRNEIERVDSFGYRLYSWLWLNMPLFFRRILLKLHNILFKSVKDLTGCK